MAYAVNRSGERSALARCKTVLSALVGLALFGCSEDSPTFSAPLGNASGRGGAPDARVALRTDSGRGGSSPLASRDAARAPRGAGAGGTGGGVRSGRAGSQGNSDGGVVFDARRVTTRGDERLPPAPGDAGHSARDASLDAGAVPSGGLDAAPDRADAGVSCAPLGLNLLTAELKNPVYATAPPGDPRIFVLERLLGRVVIFDRSGIHGTPFLDVSGNMATEGFEVGLLSLVFDPNFAKNRAFYVSYTTLANTLRVSRFEVPSTTPDTADPASESVVIDIPKNTHHNTGGMLRFGPGSFLYIGVGDDDSGSNGQDLDVPSGKLLRVAVNPSADGYTIPPDNPFVGVSGVKPEIWAYGLREPYRFWFDAGELYIADVGDNQREEIDVVAAGSRGGQNFGWPIMEGSLCHTPATGCDQTGLALPQYEFGHDSGGTAVIGGSAYRGAALPACYRGRYFFGSYSAGWVRSFRWDAGVTDVEDEPGVLDPGFVSFGEDGNGEILLLGYDQTLHRVVRKDGD